jgi:multiple sugar transport system substrate-binding protein
MNAKSVAALDAGTVPDIAYSDTYDVQTAASGRSTGKLEDLSDVLAR